MRVSATAEMPTTFMRVLGRTELNVAAMGEAVRRDLDVILVMDTSGSIGSDFGTLQQAARNSFVNKFNSGVGGDRFGLVSFASGAVLDVPIDRTARRGFDRTAVVNAISVLNAHGSTASAEGIRKGLDELNAVPPEHRSSLRVILFFSDGAPNIVNGTFLLDPSGTLSGNLYSKTPTDPPTTPSDLCSADQRDGGWAHYSNIVQLPSQGSGTVPLASFNNRRTFTGATYAQPYPYENSRCNVNKAARNMVENIANSARGQDIRIYSIGLGAALNALEIDFCGYDQATERGSTIMKRLANTADSDTLNTGQPQGLYCHAASSSELDRCFSTIASEILRLTL